MADTKKAAASKAEAKFGGPADGDKSSGRATESTNGRVAEPNDSGRADAK